MGIGLSMCWAIYREGSDKTVDKMTGEFKKTITSADNLNKKITGRWRMKNALQKEDKFKSLLETLRDWVWETDTQGRYTHIGPQVKHILGYEPEKLLGKTPFSLMPPEEAKRVAGQIRFA